MQLQIQKQTLTNTIAREQTKQRVVKKGKLYGFMWFGFFFFTLFLLFYILG
jgi:hypothetical protein